MHRKVKYEYASLILKCEKYLVSSQYYFLYKPLNNAFSTSVYRKLVLSVAVQTDKYSLKM